jgi:hypothetical protein
MTNSLLPFGSPNRLAVSIRWAVVLTASVCQLSCSEAAAPVTGSHTVLVLTTVVITTEGNSTSTQLGTPLGISVQTLDQLGAPIAVGSVSKVVSDPTIASIVLMPGQPWDYGDDEFGVGNKAGDVVLTVTASLNGVSRSATQRITILPSSSSN